MSDPSPRIATHLIIEAKIRELSAQGVGVYVIHRGEKMDGLILLKLSDTAGQCKLLTQQRNLDGVLGWVNIFNEEIIDEQKGDEYIARAMSRDPDLWVVEIETRTLENPFEEK